ncbi:MAG: VTT domain-containing protein [Clostridiales Family XIII bacterium]|jgi:uncharacterized membrane protein YdjX (TVP38/TMEM64 family)|nr:VTT domain-containing protein [Clostridiales Family XIII bacterium]
MKNIKYIKIAVFVAIIAGMPLLVIFKYPEFGTILTNREALSGFLAAHEDQGAIIFFAIQVVQVILGVLPASIIQFAGGFIFGVPLAFALSLGGTAAGAFIAFNFSRHLGKDFVVMIVKEKNVNKFVEMMETSRAYIVIILVFLIPGIPKDVFTYAAGLTKLRALPFVLTATAARSPAMLATLLFAGFLREGNYIGVGAIAAIVGAVIALAFFKRKRIFAYIESFRKRNAW